MAWSRGTAALTLTLTLTLNPNPNPEPNPNFNPNPNPTRREGDKVGHYECLTPGLQTLEGAWPGIIAAVPQLTPVDVPVDARLVFVDYEYM